MKKNLKMALSLVLALILVLGLGTAAFAAGAEDFFAGDTADGAHDGSLFLAGEKLDSTATVNGVVLAAGYDVNAAGKAEYLMGAGYNVYAAGEVSGDAFLAGNRVDISGAVARDVFAAANSVSVTGTVGRAMYIAASKVSISGEVGGDIYISSGNVKISDDAKLSGAVYCAKGADVRAPGDVLARVIWYDDPAVAQLESVSAGAETASTLQRLGTWTISLVGLIALSFVLLWLTPLWERLDAKYYGAPFAQYARVFGIGFGVLAGVPVAVVLLWVTRIGLRLGFVLALIYAAALVAAPIFLGFFIGMLIWRAALKKAPSYWAELPIGLLVCCAAKLIPGLSFAVGLVSAPLALGVIVLMLGKGKTTPPAVQPCALPADAAPET